MSINVPEPQREAFLAYLMRAVKVGPDILPPGDELMHARRAASIADVNSLEWWQSAGLVVGLHLRELREQAATSPDT